MSDGFKFASISHELRTALVNISGLANQLILQESYDESVVNKIKSSSDFLLRILDGLFDQDKSLQSKEVSVEKIIEECLSVRGSESLHIEVCASVALPLTVQTCDVILARTLRNLIDNVLTHSNANVCNIRVGVDGSFLKVAVEDNGVGLTETQRTELFYPSKGSIVGHGIGLFLSRMLVEKANGKLACKSSEPGNCVFEFILPFDSVKPNFPMGKKVFIDRRVSRTGLSRTIFSTCERLGVELVEGDGFPIISIDERDEICFIKSPIDRIPMYGFPYFTFLREVLVSNPETPHSDIGKKVKWLIVEDDPIVLQVTSLMMKSRGFDFETCSSASECLKMLDTNYDVFLIDVFLSGESGSDLADRIRREGTCGMIVGVSADQKVLDESQSFDMTVLKPLSGQLLDSIWQALMARAQ